MRSLLLALCLASCAPSFDTPAVLDHAAKLSKCQQEGREAGAGKAIKAYDACKKDAGIQ